MPHTADTLLERGVDPDCITVELDGAPIPGVVQFDDGWAKVLVSHDTETDTYRHRKMFGAVAVFLDPTPDGLWPHDEALWPEPQAGERVQFTDAPAP